MTITGRYAPKRTILEIVSFFSSSTLHFRMRLVGFFYDDKVPTLTSLVSILTDIISGLSPLEIRSSCLFIYFLFVPESSPPVSTRIILILVSAAYRSRNRNFFIILSLNIMPGRRGAFCVFRIRGPRNIRLLFIYIYWLATSFLRSAQYFIDMKYGSS